MVWSPVPGDQDAAPGSEDRPSGLELARSIARAYRQVGGSVRSGTRASPRRGRRGPADQTSGSGPDDRDPQPLRSTIDRLVAQHGWSEDVAVHGVFGRWESVVGVEVAQHCHPRRYAAGELVVEADSTAWATQMRWLAETVVRRLDAELGESLVHSIKVTGPQPPSWRRGRRSVRGRGPRDTYG